MAYLQTIPILQTKSEAIIKLLKQITCLLQAGFASLVMTPIKLK